MTSAFGITIAAILLAAQVALGNVHILTTNGLWKSITVAEWKPARFLSRLDTSNALYYPVYAAGGRWMDALGIFAGQAWRQLAVMNALFAAAAAAMAFAFVARWTGRPLVALLAASAYTLSGYVLMLALINEDIIPGFSVVLAATLLGVAWFGAPTAIRIGSVAAVFALGWLFEWRLLFPALPAFLLALFMAPGRIWQRLARPFGFLLAMTLTVWAVAWLAHYRGVRMMGGGGVLDVFLALLWTGKGVDTGWAGFSWQKAWLLWSGMAEAVFGGRHLANPDWLGSAAAPGVLMGTMLGLVLAGFCLAHVRRRWADPTVRAAFFVVGGTFLAGSVFNLYSQPQDPQMQINVMIWSLFGWTLLIGWLVNAGRARARLTLAVALILVVAVSTYTFSTAWAARGGDTRQVAFVNRFEATFDPAWTVVAWNDFDGTISWIAAMWGNQQPNVARLGPAPQPTPKWKWIGLVREAVESPRWTGVQHAQDIIRQVDHAHELGYRVVANAFLTQGLDAWVNTLAVVSTPAKAAEIHATLDAALELRPVWTDPFGGTWYEIQRRPR